MDVPVYTYWRDCALGVFAHAAGIASGKKNSQKGAEAAVKRLSADAERSLQEMRNDMLGRVNRPEMVWGLVSATLGSRRNCQLIARSVLGKAAEIFLVRKYKIKLTIGCVNASSGMSCPRMSGCAHVKRFSSWTVGSKNVGSE